MRYVEPLLIYNDPPRLRPKTILPVMWLFKLAEREDKGRPEPVQEWAIGEAASDQKMP